jgi:hypothetical protein
LRDGPLRFIVDPMEREPFLDRDLAMSGMWLLTDILAKLEAIRRLLSGEEE